MDPTLLAEHLAELLAAALVPAAGWLLTIARRWHINTTVLRAVARGAGTAYLSLLQDRQGTTPGAIERAVAAGAAYVEARVPGAVDKAGMGAEDVAQAVRAQLGTLLAADPSVRVGGGS